MNGIIYLITNLVNDKKYVGKTSQLVERRWQNHVWGSQKSRYKGDRAIYRAIRKYGHENFRISILEQNIPSLALLNAREIFWIAELNTADGNSGYNMSKGGEGQAGNKASEETRRRISAALKGNKYNLGKRASDETRRKLSIAHSGERNCWYGKPMHPNARAALAVAHAAQENDPIYVAKRNEILRQNAIRNRGVPRPDVAENNHRRFTGVKCPQNAVIHAGNKYAANREWKPESLAKMSQAKIGSRCINNGIIARFMPVGATIPDGWEFGRLRGSKAA